MKIQETDVKSIYYISLTKTNMQHKFCCTHAVVVIAVAIVCKIIFYIQMCVV